MAEYISKEKAIKELREVYENEYPTASGDFDEYASHDVPNVLRNMKAADVQPVKHGYWKEEEPRVLKCSVCGEYAPMNYLGQNCIDSRYCPWCGARMIKGGDTNG